MWFHFLLANHDPVGKLTLIDMIQWFEAGLSECGHTVTIGDRAAPNALNIIWDSFRPGDAQWLCESGLRYGVVATEIPDGTGLNWRQEAEWMSRWQALQEVAKGAVFIWSMIESSVADYARFAPTSYIELGFSERLVPYQGRFDPEFDFGFWGLLTPHRKEILEKLQRSCKVALPGRILPPGDLADFIGRCRIGICFKQSPQWPIPSPTRLGRLLHARRGVAAEYVPVPTRQGSFVPFAAEGSDFAEFCLERLSRPWRREADEAFDRYRTSMPMKQIMERVLEESLGLGGNKRIVAASAPDEVRVSPGSLQRKPEPVLLYSYGTYNVVQCGDVFMGIAQKLGPLDVGSILDGDASRPPESDFFVADSEEAIKSKLDVLFRDSETQ